MEVEDIEKTVLAYLKGKGYRLAELGFQWEKDRCRPPRLLGCLILQGSGDNTVRLWDVHVGENVCICIGHRSMMLSWPCLLTGDIWLLVIKMERLRCGIYPVDV